MEAIPSGASPSRDALRRSAITIAEMVKLVQVVQHADELVHQLAARAPHAVDASTFYSRWDRIPLHVLRGFAQDLRDLHTDRGVAALTGLSAASIQDFALGRTTARRRTIRLFAELYLAYQEAKGLRAVLPRLASVLPGGPEGALRIIDILIRAGIETQRIEAAALYALGDWLRMLVLSEYGNRQDGAISGQRGAAMRKRRKNRSVSGTEPA